MRITGWVSNRANAPVDVFGEKSIEEMRSFLIENNYIGKSSPDYPEFPFRNEEELDQLLSEFVSGEKTNVSIEVWDEFGNIKLVHLEGKRD